jgi:Mn2+/Fe2+ NRAMP family transporter
MKIIIIILSISTITAVLVAVFNSDKTFSFTQILPEGTIEISFLIAFLGWMPAPLDISIWHSLWAIEKKKDNIEFDTKKSIFDFNIGYLGTIILGICFISLGALVMFGSEEKFSGNAGQFAHQFIGLYIENMGESMHIVIGIAAFTTMFSTTLTTLDASPRAMSKTMELLSNKKNNNLYWIWISILFIGTMLILKYFISEMGTLIKLATILSFLTAPFYAIINFLLISGKHTPKEWRPTTGMKILSYSGILFLLGFNVWFLLNL